MTDTLSRPGRGAGWIEVIVGSMFSGKTEELIKRLRRAQIARQRVQVFKPRIDDRYGTDHVISHSEQKVTSSQVDNAEAILSLVDDQTRVVGIDEGQFFGGNLVDVCQKLANRGIRVIIAGLDTDWRGLPFEPMPQLMAVAEMVLKSNAICVVCGGMASRTQRLGSSTAQVEVGAADMYEARCRGCFDPHLNAAAAPEKTASREKKKKSRSPTGSKTLTSEVQHRYGSHVHILNDNYLSSMLTRLCQPQTHQPTINELIEFLYTDLIRVVLNNEFPTIKIKTATRMTAKHPAQLLEATVLDTNQRAISVNLARAGTFPSHICYNALNYILNPELVRQDHVTAARTVDEKFKVTGTSLGGSKIGGDVDKAIVIFPDPMGATGGTLVSTLDFYKKSVKGQANKFIALHLIITPEYLKRVTAAHPDLVVYAVRLDRGLSASEILKTTPGERWNDERGLDETDYIVPGGGGFGEILNNSYV